MTCPKFCKAVRFDFRFRFDDWDALDLTATSGMSLIHALFESSRANLRSTSPSCGRGPTRFRFQMLPGVHLPQRLHRYSNIQLPTSSASFESSNPKSLQPVPRISATISDEILIESTPSIPDQTAVGADLTPVLFRPCNQHCLDTPPKSGSKPLVRVTRPAFRSMRLRS